MAVYKNAASQKLAVFAVDSTGAAKTGDAANITAYISKDGGAAAASNDTNPTELDATNAKGIYLFDLTQAETNADLVVIVPKSATSGVTLRPVIIYTVADIYARIGQPAGASVSADIAAVQSTATATQAKTDNLPSDPADASDIAGAFSTVNTTLSTIAGYIDTEIQAIKSKTDNLPADPADASDIAASFSSIASTLSTIAGYIDTEISAIKVKTDALPADPADASDIAASFSAISDIVAAIKTVTDAISATGAGLSAIPWNAAWDAEVQSECADAITAANVSTLTAAQVNAEVVDALATDTYAEPGQGTPGATISLAAKINYLYKFLRNKKTQTADTKSIYNDDAATVDHKCTVSDDGTTYTETEITSGP